MNKQIRSLAEQAGIYQLDIGDETAYWVLENFASLIIKECADVAANHDALDIYEEILEHFGVES